MMLKKIKTKLLSKRWSIKALVTDTIKNDWPNARVTGSTDPNEQLIRRSCLYQYDMAIEQLEETLAKASQRIASLIDKTSEASLKQCGADAKRVKHGLTDLQFEPLPEVDFDKNRSSHHSVATRFKKMRLNFACVLLVFMTAATNNTLIFATSTSNVELVDVLSILTLTLLVMGLINLSGRFSHVLLHGQRFERAWVVLIGVANTLVLFLFYLTLAHLLLDNALSSINDAFSKTMYSIPAVRQVNEWFLTGIATGLVGYVLGIWSDDVVLMGLRARCKVIKKRIRTLQKAQKKQAATASRWSAQRQKAVRKIEKSVRVKERALESTTTTLAKIKREYINSINEYRSILASWSGTPHVNMEIMPLFDIEPCFQAIEENIAKDKDNLSTLQNGTERIRYKVNDLKKHIFDCFEEEIKRLQSLSLYPVTNHKIERVTNLKIARKNA